MLVVAYIVAFLDRQIIALLIDTIKAELKINDVEISLLQGLAFALAFCLATLPVGWLVDRYSRRLVLVAGILIWSVGTALCGLAGSFGLLFAARMVVGLGEAFLSPAAYSMIIDAFPRDRIVRALSIYTMAGTLGIGAAFLSGSAVMRMIGAMPSLAIGLPTWQAAFLLVSIPGFFTVLLLLLVKEPPRNGSDLKDAAPFLEVVRFLLRNWRSFLPIFMCSGLLGIAYFAGFSWYAAHLGRVHGIAPQSAGSLLGTLYLCTCTIGTALGVAFSEYLQRQGRMDAPLRTVFFISLIAAAASGYAAVDNLYLSLALLVIQSLALGSFFGNCVAALQIITPARMRGANSAAFALWNALVSLAVGPTIIGALSDRVFPDRADGLGISVAIVCVTCASISAVIAGKGLASFARSATAFQRQA